MLGRAAGWRDNPKSLRLGTHFVQVAVDDATRLAFRARVSRRARQDGHALLSEGHLVLRRRWHQGRGGDDRLRALLPHIAPQSSGAPPTRRDISSRRPYRPQTNGKAERFIQTLIREWVYTRLYHTNDLRLPPCLAGCISIIRVEPTQRLEVRLRSMLSTTYLGTTAS